MRAPLRCRHGPERAGTACWGAGARCMRRWMCFRSSFPPQVDIQTEAPGFSPQQVEELVTRPVENAVNGASGLATLRSESIPGLSVVTITFADNIDLHIARQGISERLSELGSSLPTGVGRAETLAAGLQHHGSAQDRPGVGQGRCLCTARRGRLGDQAAAAGRAGSGARHRLRRQRAPDPDPTRHAAADELRHHADRHCRCGTCGAAAAGRRIHRPRQPARADAVADTGARS